MMISQTGELKLLERIRSAFASIDARVAVPIGDDAAVFSVDQNKIVVTTDLMSEAVHFDYAYTTCYQVGYKLVSSNVSDIYAMGGTPGYLFLDMAMVKEHTDHDFDEFLRGVAESARIYGVGVLGGDISSSLHSDFFAATIVGTVERPVTRAGANVGDRIFLSGTVGDAAAGLAFLKDLNRSIPLEHESGDHDLDADIARSVRKHLLPVAVNPARICGQCNAMIDISDGLLLDMSRICEQSGVGAVLYEEKIPVSSGTKKIASQLGVNELEFAIAGGEDYELLVVSEGNGTEDGIEIGKIVENGLFLVDSAGREMPVEPRGYTHFT